MPRLVTSILLLSLMSSFALAEDLTHAKKHLLVYKSESLARQHCPADEIVWASTASHTMYLPGDKHYAHTHGGYACESQGRASGYKGPTSHG
jgi:hypothetical protein